MSPRPIWLLPLECDFDQPSGPLVYRLYDRHLELLYVGMTDTFARYRIQKHLWYTPWGPQVEYFSLEYHRMAHLALDAERAAIKAERPLFNLRSVVVA